MNANHFVKVLIRSLLVMASFWMIVGNWNNNAASFTASTLFFIANVTALIWNETKRS